MNYSDDTKENVLNNLGDDKSSNFAFLMAITKCCASIQVYKDGFQLDYEFKQENLAKLILFRLRQSYDFELNFEFSSQSPRIFHVLAKGKGVNEMLKEMRLTHYQDQKLVYCSGVDSFSLLTNRAVAQSFVQAVFCSVGSVYIPSDIDSKEGYQLEINLFQEDFANALVQLMQDCGIELNCSERGTSYVVYSKNSQVICDFLAFIKAMDMVTFLNDIIIRRQVNNQINRASNIMVFNTDKIALANSKYIEAINKIVNSKGIDSLEEKLKLVANARLEDHTESMSNLANRLNISKSSLNRALAKLIKIAEELN